MTDAELAELNLVFDMQWEADQRAIKAWQAAHPERPNVWPDRCDMVMWLMEHYAQSEARALKAEADAEWACARAAKEHEYNEILLGQRTYLRGKLDKAEAALREVVNLYDNMGWSPDELPTHMGRIARTALEGKL